MDNTINKYRPPNSIKTIHSGSKVRRDNIDNDVLYLTNLYKEIQTIMLNTQFDQIMYLYYRTTNKLDFLRYKMKGKHITIKAETNVLFPSVPMISGFCAEPIKLYPFTEKNWSMFSF